MLGIYDVQDVGCEGRGMFRKWDVPDVGCSGCGIFGGWDVHDVGCSRCEMFGRWDVRDVRCSGCGMIAGMWDVDFHNADKSSSFETRCIFNTGGS